MIHFLSNLTIVDRGLAILCLNTLLLKYTLTVPFLYTHMLISSMKTDESKPDEKKKVAIKKLIFHLLSSKWLFTVSLVPTRDSCYNCASFTRYKINIITTQS